MNNVKPPKRLKVRPQWRGLPIPYIALITPDGAPDFRVTDEQKRSSVIRNRWCQLCGEPLGKFFFFVGGTEAAKANQYFEPAAHLDCLIYAMQVCPFIVGRIEHADLEKVQRDLDTKVARCVTDPESKQGITVTSDETFSAVRNPFWVIKKANGWSLLKTQQGTILLYPWVVSETKPLHPESMTPADWRNVMKELSL
jgi:hypothetical protein